LLYYYSENNFSNIENVTIFNIYVYKINTNNTRLILYYFKRNSKLEVLFLLKFKFNYGKSYSDLIFIKFAFF